jgi:hypothetical protein
MRFMATAQAGCTRSGYSGLRRIEGGAAAVRLGAEDSMVIAGALRQAVSRAKAA